MLCKTAVKHMTAISCCLFALTLLPSCKSPFKGNEPSATRGAESAVLIESLTVVPVIAAGKPSVDIGQALGLTLEKAGVKDVYAWDTPFQPTPGVTQDEAIEEFARFVQAQPMKTDHALLATFSGNRKGVRAVRAFVANRRGQIVWRDKQTPSDRDFKRLRVRNPMTCCQLVAQRLKPSLVLVDPKTTSGRMQQLWADKSGLPSKAERDAMAARLDKLKTVKSQATIAVYPVHVYGVDDEAGVGEMVAAIGKCGMSAAVAAKEGVSFDIGGSSNEQRVLWNCAKGFRKAIRAAEIDTDYALYAHYVICPNDGHVMGVHFIVCDKAGEWVIVDFQNEHHPDFRKIDPKAVSDCHRLVEARLAKLIQ